jgi:predicted 2-oxoglutarate/Fe(II)-dependent dioxygenase YbiX
MIFAKKYEVIQQFITKEECDFIIDKCLNELELIDAPVYDNVSSVRLIEDKRKSKIAFTNGLDDIGNKISKKLSELIEIKGFSLKLYNFQFTKYENGDFFDWHTDSSDTMYKERFLTIVIQLSDAYIGGEFQLMLNNDEEITMESGVGNLFIFPAATKHRVKEIINGTRFSIVNWIHLEKIENYKKTIL